MKVLVHVKTQALLYCTTITALAGWEITELDECIELAIVERYGHDPEALPLSGAV